MKYAAASFLLAVACSRASAPAVPEPTVDDVDRMLAANTATAIDANNQGTRERMGVVPGAVRLTSYDAYALGELPTDKARTLVFYCANVQCTASHTAAARAKQAGWTQVAVMPDGIDGWVKSGKKVEPL